MPRYRQWYIIRAPGWEERCAKSFRSLTRVSTVLQEGRHLYRISEPVAMSQLIVPVDPSPTAATASRYQVIRAGRTGYDLRSLQGCDGVGQSDRLVEGQGSTPSICW